MIRRRLHLFEWEDLPWFPARLRAYLTELLRHQAATLYAPAAPILAGWMRRCGCRSVVDLFSGAGGPWPALRPRLAADGLDAPVLLTDLHPYLAGEDGPRMRYHRTPVDATDLPEALGDCATAFTGFHHLRPADARSLLRRFAERGVPLAVFEFTERRPVAVLGMLLSPLRVWADTPAVRPFRWGRLFWTYAVPVVPLVYLWDGMVSHLRSYTLEELGAMTAGLGGEGYEWEAGRAADPGGGPPVTYLLGSVPPGRRAGPTR